MSALTIVADVYSTVDNPETYRVYINDTLMSERVFRWIPGKEYVEEHIVIDGPPGKYSIYVTPLSEFEIRRVLIDGQVANDTFDIK